MQQFIGIIPARYASTRFPGKPLAIIDGKTMIERVYNQAKKILDYVYVATDDLKIETAVKNFGGNVVMTSTLHQSGTDRCAEALSIIRNFHTFAFDVVINIQGDEPFIQPDQIKRLMGCFDKPETQIATLAKTIEGDGIFDPNNVKVVKNKNNEALLFSRSAIPYIRGRETNLWSASHTYLKHIGIYAYRVEILNKLTTLQQTSLELAESLEQLRWLENGYKIRIELTDFETISIDTPQDLEKVKGLLA